MTEVVCAVFQYRGQIIEWVPIDNELPIETLRQWLEQGGIPTAHNWDGFDRFIWERFVSLPYTKAIDTQHYARALGLPAKLDLLAKRLLGDAKHEAVDVMKKLSRTNLHKPLTSLRGAVHLVRDYCRKDVALLAQIAERLVGEQTEPDDVIEIHRRINDRGITVDREHARDLIERWAAARAEHAATLTSITGIPLDKIRSTQRFTAWLKDQGLKIPSTRRDLLKKIIDTPELLDEADDVDLEEVAGMTPDMAVAIAARLQVVKMGEAKAIVALRRCSSDGRMRDNFIYCGAHTGRWSGVGAQIQNMPRAKSGLDAEMRAILRAADGKSLVISDFSKIEAVVLAVLAEQTDVACKFADESWDIYREMAAFLYQIPIEQVTAAQRAVGKQIILACGYQMSATKFALTCANMGINLNDVGVTAEQAVEAYRDKHRQIAGYIAGEFNGKPVRRGGFWQRAQQAAKLCIETKQPQTLGSSISFSYDHWGLRCQLPSGRKLTYHNARVEDRAIPGTDVKVKSIVYSGAYGLTSTYGGKIVENIVQATSRDLLVGAMRNVDPWADIVMHIHDELIIEVDKSVAAESLSRLTKDMATLPSWASGWPVRCEGQVSDVYTK